MIDQSRLNDIRPIDSRKRSLADEFEYKILSTLSDITYLQAVHSLHVKDITGLVDKVDNYTFDYIKRQLVNFHKNLKAIDNKQDQKDEASDV